MTSLASLSPLLAPLVLIAASAFAGRAGSPRAAQRWAERAAGAALAVAVAAGVLVAVAGPATSPLLGAQGLGLAVRLDALSAVMFGLVAFLGLVVVRFSRNYLFGDPGQARFASLLCLTLAAVILLVLAGNLLQLVLAWIATSLVLHRLLVFYPDRPAARLAARKKAIVARAADVALVAAAAILYVGAGTGDIAPLLAEAGAIPGAPVAAALVVLAACLKSAQAPVHGWLPEVMETPTPVSALLHAGIVNAGGFLVLRFADLVLTAPAAMTAMAAVGAVTALLGALVMLTQTSAKVTLAWSTVAQMGFMMLQLGLGAFALALVHIVGHSLYKAHAFLSAGGAVAQVRAGAPSEDVTPGTALAALLASLALAGLAWAAWGGTIAETPVRFGFALVLAIALAPFVAAATAARSWPGTAAALAGAGLVAVAYLALTGAADRAMAGALPAAPDLGTAGTGLLGLVVAGLAGLALLQSTLPGWAHDARARRLRVLVANGFYANALFDRVAGRLGRPLA